MQRCWSADITAGGPQRTLQLHSRLAGLLCGGLMKAAQWGTDMQGCDGVLYYGTASYSH